MPLVTPFVFLNNSHQLLIFAKQIEMMTNKLKSLWIVAVLIATTIQATFSQTIPSFGTADKLEVGTWNLEWFGSTVNGPTNESTQFNNIKKVLNNTDIDIWGVEEMSDLATWDRLLDELPQYGGILASYNQTQKTAILYKKDLFEVFTYSHVLTGSTFSTAFASRPPLEVGLITKAPLPVDTIYVLVIHLKAFSDEESYVRRQQASTYLKNNYLDPNRSNYKTIVCGDWNDDLDRSIYNNLESPFKNFLDDEDYFFATRALSAAGGTSYSSYSGSFIDHILANGPMAAYYVPNSTKVLNMLTSYISGFTNNTSDHYPVIASFNFGTGSTVGIDELLLDEMKIGFAEYDKSIFATGNWSGTMEIRNTQGQLIASVEKEENQNAFYNVVSLPKGMYFVTLTQSNTSKNFKILL